MTRRTLYALCTLIQALIPSAACAQNPNPGSALETTALVRGSTTRASNPTYADAKGATSLRFDLIDNRIVIDVWLNGKGPFRFIFDSGGVAIVSPEVARALGLKVTGTSTGGRGVGEKTVERGAANINEVKVGDILLTDEEFGVISFADTKYVFGANRIDGIIGYPLFKRFVVKIDYEQQRL
ncbi:MAG: retropepsin-like domain-containing protein, partial [Acidobacteriota bacterium]|nr:retropepsin-like domain-containing protein [Acidobacteriota bacterium]